MSMIDNYKRKYGRAFAKQSIEMYIRNQKFSSVEEFFKKNPDVTTFEANSQLLGIIRTHGYYVLNDAEYKEIINELKQAEEQSKKLNTDNLTSTMVNGHEIVTYTDESGEQITVDNTVTNRDVKDQMHDVQKQHAQFQEKGANNSLNIMNYMKDNIKITPDTTSTNDIDLDSENVELKEIVLVAKAFENEIGHHVDIDLNSKIIYDNGITYSVEKRDGEYKVIRQDMLSTENKKEKGPQLVKKASKYNNAA